MSKSRTWSSFSSSSVSSLNLKLANVHVERSRKCLRFQVYEIWLIKIYPLPSQPQMATANLDLKGADYATGYIKFLFFFFLQLLHRSARWYTNGTLSPMRGISPSLYPLTKDSHNTGNFTPYSFRIMCEFFNVPHWTYKHGIYLWDGTYGLQSLSEKNWKSNHFTHCSEILHTQITHINYIDIYTT